VIRLFAAEAMIASVGLVGSRAKSSRIFVIPQRRLQRSLFLVVDQMPGPASVRDILATSRGVPVTARYRVSRALHLGGDEINKQVSGAPNEA
jgi:hypothetical protein